MSQKKRNGSFPVTGSTFFVNQVKADSLSRQTKVFRILYTFAPHS